MITYHYQKADYNPRYLPLSLCGLYADVYRAYLVPGKQDTDAFNYADKVCPSCAILHMLKPEDTRTARYTYSGEYQP